MSDIQSHEPYLTLGKHLRYVREQHMESLAEVSGAVEIDEKALEKIEAGRERPAEDILLLLISHFDMQDQEAVQLWELAGYDGVGPSQVKEEDVNVELQGQKPVMVLFGIDARTMYTDHVEVSANNAGIAMNFGLQHSQKQPMPIAKLGMSYEQAERVLATLQIALLQGKYLHGPKVLPPNASSNNDAN